MSFGTCELAAITDLVRSVSRTEIMPRFHQLTADAVRSKTGPLDLVTDADETAEARLTESLTRLFPGCAVVGEEATAADESVLGRLATHDLAFTVDPVDGTLNFAAGLPLFGVMVAAVVTGEVAAAVIHDPVKDEAALALTGQGAWLEAADGSRSGLHVAEPAPVETMTALISWRFMPEPQRSLVCRNLPRFAAVWDLRCAAHQYRMAAGGHAHALAYTKLMPWDHAAGWLLHKEAGGYAALYDGSPYRPAVTGGGLICAPDEASWRAVRDALLEA